MLKWKLINWQVLAAESRHNQSTVHSHRRLFVEKIQATESDCLGYAVDGIQTNLLHDHSSVTSQQASSM